MALTKEEALWVADVAMSYPTGHGAQWGWGPLKDDGLDYVLSILEDNPQYIWYG
jgi:hypothetical protein